MLISAENAFRINILFQKVDNDKNTIPWNIYMNMNKRWLKQTG